MKEELQKRIARAIEAEAELADSQYEAAPVVAAFRIAARIAQETPDEGGASAGSDGWIELVARTPDAEPGDGEPEYIEYLVYSGLTGMQFLATWDAANRTFRDDECSLIPGITHWRHLPEGPR